jgi:hypothetical protein
LTYRQPAPPDERRRRFEDVYAACHAPCWGTCCAALIATSTALFSASPGARVTLRTSAADAAGGSITETITSAYATSSR